MESLYKKKIKKMDGEKRPKKKNEGLYLKKFKKSVDKLKNRVYDSRREDKGVFEMEG